MLSRVVSDSGHPCDVLNLAKENLRSSNNDAVVTKIGSRASSMCTLCSTTGSSNPFEKERYCDVLHGTEGFKVDERSLSQDVRPCF